jgi:hypothetical protein
MQSLRLEKQILSRYRFDLVIINNMGSDRRLHEFSMEDKQYMRSELGYRINGIVTKSRLVCWIRDIATGRNRMQPPCAPPKGISRVSVADYKANLLEMIREAKSHGAEVMLFAPFPLHDSAAERVRREEREREPRYLEAMRQAAAEGGAHFCDLPARTKGLDLKTLCLDATHPNPRGHLSIAMILGEESLQFISRKFPLKRR